MFVYLPIWPLRVVHLRLMPGGSFQPDVYEAIPLRWSDQLVRHVMLRRWFAGAILAALLVLLMLALITLWPPAGNAAKEWAVTKPILTPLAPCLMVVGILGLWSLRRHTRRECDIRCLLGPHELGASDPANWLDDDRSKMKSAEALFGMATYAAAVPKLLEKGARSGAMWAARLTVAREDETIGQELTNVVLRHPDTQEALACFRHDATCWPAAMGVEALLEYQSLRTAAEPQPLFDLGLLAELTAKQTTEKPDQVVAAVAALFTLIGLGVGAWLGSAVSAQIACLGAVGGAVVGAAVGVFLGLLFTNR